MQKLTQLENPFGKNVNLLSWRTWLGAIGVVAFGFIVFAVGKFVASWVTSKAPAAAQPVLGGGSSMGGPALKRVV